MATMGRISFLVSKELLILSQALNQAEPEIRKQITKQTKSVVAPVWEEAVRSKVTNRMQARTLGSSARVGVTGRNVFLRAGAIGKVGTVPVSTIARQVEFGADREAYRPVRGKNGTYRRRTRRQLQLPRSRGYVVHPAAAEVIPRVASLWIQTAVRAIHEQLEKGGARG